MSFYFIRIEDEAQTGLPMGYELGLIDKFNPAPKGAQVVETQGEVDKLIAAADEADMRAIDQGIAEEMPPEECPIQIPEGRRWFTDTVTAAIDPSLSKRDQAHLTKCIKVHQKWVAENSSLRYEIIGDYESALHKITASVIDGPSNTLAQNEMTYQPTTDRIIKCTTRFDSSDGLDHVTGLHEFCHGDGLKHQEDDPQGLMFWLKNNAAFYGQNERDEYAARYPKAKLA